MITCERLQVILSIIVAATVLINRLDTIIVKRMVTNKGAMRKETSAVKMLYGFAKRKLKGK